MTEVKLERILEVRGKRFRLTVETSPRPEDYRKYEDLRNEIWGFPEDHLSGTRNLLGENFLHEGSSLFIAAYREDPGLGWIEDEDHLVGFAYGFVGVRDKSITFREKGNLWFYAQFLGVREGWQGYGLGMAIKEFQRDIVRDLFGITLITCTYDPLTGVNAYRNVHLFGMEVLEYRIAPYGEYGGRLNRLDIPSDRFFMGWNLLAAPSRPKIREENLLPAENLVTAVEEIKVEGKEGPVFLEVIREINPSPRISPVLLQIPRDFYLMLRVTDVPSPEVRRIPLEWRLKTRELFLSLFDRGYRVVDFLVRHKDGPRNFYLLQKDKA